MYSVSPSYKSKIASGSRSLNCYAVVGSQTYYNDTIETISYEDTVNPEDVFAVGTASSAYLEITLLNVTGNFDGSQVKPYIGVDITGTGNFEYVPLGVFNVEQTTKNKGSITLKCFDNMIKAELPYSTTLSYPASLTSIMNEISTKTGIVFSGTLPNYYVPSVEAVSFREVIGLIAGVCGGFAKVDRSGVLKIKSYAVSLVKTIGDTNYFDLNKEDAAYTIGKVTIANSGGELSYSRGTVTPTTMELIITSPWASDTIVSDVYTKLNGLSFMPLEMKWQGDPALDVGDWVTVNEYNGQPFNTIMTEVKISYSGGMSADFSSKCEGKTKNQYNTNPVVSGAMGPPGPQGEPGDSSYTWTMYGDDKFGANITSNPAGRMWRGVAYNKSTEIPSTNPSDYTWAFITDGWVKTGTVKIDGGSIYADDLSVISANIGTMTAGKLTNGNGTTELNLTAGTFKLGGTKLVFNGTNLSIDGNVVSQSSNGSRVLKTTISDGSFQQDWLSVVATNGGYDVVVDAFNGIQNRSFENTNKSVIGRYSILNWSGLEIGNKSTVADGGLWNGYITFSKDYDQAASATFSELYFDNLSINLNNNNLKNVNHITIADAGGREGIEWIGGNGWLIVETSDDGTLNNAAAPLQFFNNAGRQATIGPTGNVYCTGSAFWIQNATQGNFRSNGTTTITAGSGTYVAVGNDGTNRVWSNAIWGRTYTAGTGIGTMAITDQGTLGRLSSSRRYKLSIEDVQQQAIDRILDLNPRTWFDKTATEEFADYLTASMENPDAVMPDIGGDIRRGVGLIAEEVEALGLDEFVIYDKDTEGNLVPQGLMYDRMWVYLIPVLKDQRKRIESLEEKINTLIQ